MEKRIRFSIPFVAVLLLLVAGTLQAAEIPARTYFRIQSAKEYGRSTRGVWDIKGKPTAYKRGMNIQVWDFPRSDRNSRDRYFSFRKVRGNIYEISSMLHSRSRVDVAGGRRRNGTNIGLWDSHHGKNQQFKMAYRGNGRWKIYPMIGGVVCLKSKSSKNGTNVHIWNDHNGPWTEWVLIQSGLNRAFRPEKQRRRAAMGNRKMRAGVTLRSACLPKNNYQTREYFSKVNPGKFKLDNRNDPLHQLVNSLRDSKRFLVAKDIISAIGNNHNAASRLLVYRELYNSNIFSSNNFLAKIVVTQIKKTVNKNYRYERNRSVKNILRMMIRKF